MNLPPKARIALYYMPAPADPLWPIGSAWLGRDAVTGAQIAQPPHRAAITREPRRFGLHATLKAPFRPCAAWPDIIAAARTVAAAFHPFALPPLVLGLIDGFLALLPAAPSPALHALADAVVTQLDPLRAALTDDELHHRRQAGLSPQQEQMLAVWGYPDVLTRWRFHITLSERLAEGQTACIQQDAAPLFAPALAVPRMVRDVCLCVQPSPDAPFTVAERISLVS